MGYENPQRPAQVFYPQGHPKHAQQQRVHPEQPTPPAGEVEQPASQASALPDLGDVIRGIVELADELRQVFFTIPGVADETGRVDPQKFDASMQQAFITAGNALDHAVRLVSEKRGWLRVAELRKELSDEMRSLGITGDPINGESPMPPDTPQVG